MGTVILERLRQIAGTDGTPNADFECRGCGALFEAQRQVCPECGGFYIDRTDW